MKTYSYTKPSPLSFDETYDAIKKALAAEELGVVTEMNVQKTLLEKTGKEIEPYIILGACHPTSAYEAIAMEQEIGLLLPCNVIIYVQEGVAYISSINPEALMAVAGNDELTELAADITTRLERAVDAVAQPTNS